MDDTAIVINHDNTLVLITSTTRTHYSTHAINTKLKLSFSNWLKYLKHKDYNRLKFNSHKEYQYDKGY